LIAVKFDSPKGALLNSGDKNACAAEGLEALCGARAEFDRTGKVACSVLRGRRRSNALLLPDARVLVDSFFHRKATMSGRKKAA